MPNVAYMFQAETHSRGDIISIKGEPLSKMYVVEEGDIGVVPNPIVDHHDRKLTNTHSVDYVERFFDLAGIFEQILDNRG